MYRLRVILPITVMALCLFNSCKTVPFSENHGQKGEVEFGFLTGAEQEIRMIAHVGGNWVRPHPGPFAWGWIEPRKGEYRFQRVDDYVRLAGEYNISILATIWPFADWDQKRCHGSDKSVGGKDHFFPRGKGDGIPAWRGIPCNMNDYAAFLTKLVERYDGDGIEDMPGLKKAIKHWEVLNEPAIRGKDLTFFKGNPEEYYQLLKISYTTIKKADPESLVVQGGAMGINEEALAYWGEVFDLGGDRYFDIANIHYINFGDNSLNVRGFKKLLTEYNIHKPIWITEASFQRENQVKGAVMRAINSGANTIFFTQFKIGQKGPPQPGVYSDTIVDTIQNFKEE